MNLFVPSYTPKMSDTESKIAGDVPLTTLPTVPETTLPVVTAEVPVVDPLVAQLRAQLSLVIDVKHLNASNVLEAIIKGMQIVKDIKTTTNEQKKILLLSVLVSIIKDSDLGQSTKDDLIWVVDEMGPASVELFLVIAGKGVSTFQAAKPGCLSCIVGCFKCFSCC